MLLHVSETAPLMCSIHHNCVCGLVQVYTYVMWTIHLVFIHSLHLCTIQRVLYVYIVHVYTYTVYTILYTCINEIESYWLLHVYYHYTCINYLWILVYHNTAIPGKKSVSEWVCVCCYVVHCHTLLNMYTCIHVCYVCLLMCVIMCLCVTFVCVLMWSDVKYFIPLDTLGRRSLSD